MPPSRDVRSLYEIADKHHSRRRPKETLHAKALLKLIKKEALAFTEPDSSKLRELVDSFHHCQSVARLYPGSEQQKDSILQFLNIVDECFFFKALTRRVDTKKNGRQPLMALTVKDGYHNNRDSETIRGGTYRFPIESVLHTCVHEAIHAFFFFFEDEDHPKREERVGKDGEHGSVFIEMLRVIGERIEELTNSREWREARSMDPYGPDPTPQGFGGIGAPPGGFAPPGFPPGGFPPPGFPPPGFPPGGLPPPGFPPGGPPPPGHPPGFPPGGFPPPGFPPGGLPPGFPGFPPNGFPPGGLPGGVPPGRLPPGGFPPFPPGGFPPGFPPGFPFRK